MRCLTPAEIEELFGAAGFSVPAQAEGRARLELDLGIHGRQSRIGGRPPPDVGNLLYFARALNLWLADEGARLLWIDRWEAGPYQTDDALILALRQGLGESRPIVEAPGHHAGAYPWHVERTGFVGGAAGAGHDHGLGCLADRRG